MPSARCSDVLVLRPVLITQKRRRENAERPFVFVCPLSSTRPTPGNGGGGTIKKYGREASRIQNHALYIMPDAILG